MPSTFLVPILLAYLISGLLFGLYLKKFSQLALRLGRWALGVSSALHWGFLIAILYRSGSFVPATSIESHFLISALLGTACWFLSARKSAILIVLGLLPIVCLSLLTIHFYAPLEIVYPPPTPWLWTHVVLTLVGEAFFCFCAVVSLVYLVAEYRLKTRSVSHLFARMPSLSDFDRFMGETLAAGFAFLTLGLLLGFSFAGDYWQDDWLWDPKIIFCVLTWIWYGVIFFLRKFSRHYQGRPTAILATLGFLGILFISWGMDYFVPSRHHLERVSTPRDPL